MFSVFAAHGQGFQKVVRYLGEEDYMEHAAFHDSAQAVFGLGYVTDSDNVRILVRYDLNGNAVWQQASVDGPDDYYTYEDLTVVGNGVFVGGDADGDSSASFIMRYDLNGTPSWARIFSYYPDHVDIKVLGNDDLGAVLFGGQVFNFGAFHFDGMVGKIRASDGAPMWMSTIGDTLDIQVAAVAATPTGEVIAAGNVDDWPIQVAHFPWIAKWSANGTLLWCKKLDYNAIIYSVKADANTIYLAGVDYQNGSDDRAFVAKFTQSGTLTDWKALDNPDVSTFVQDMKLDADGVTIIAPYSENLSGLETSLIMRLDTALQPVYAWLDEYAVPYAVAGTDASGMLHFVGSYFSDPNNDEVIVLGAIPDAPISSIPCGMVPFAPVFVSETPAITNYLVTPGSTNRSGYASTNTFSLPITPLTDCIGTAMEDATAAIEAWPNPTTGLLHLRLPAEELPIVLHATDGREILRTKGTGMSALDLSAMPAGIFLLRIGAGAEAWTTRVVRVD